MNIYEREDNATLSTCILSQLLVFTPQDFFFVYY